MLGYVFGVAFRSVSNGKIERNGSFMTDYTCDGQGDAKFLRSVHCVSPHSAENKNLVICRQLIRTVLELEAHAAQPASATAPRHELALTSDIRLLGVGLLRRAIPPKIAKDKTAHATGQGKTYYVMAFRALRKLRNTKLQAARDLFLINHQLREEMSTQPNEHQPLRELFTVARNRRALTASLTCMIFQQLCGVNIMPYYSSSILLNAGAGPGAALTASMGFGIINWTFALPAFWTIDTFGRRKLLLATFPAMAMSHALIAIAFRATTNSPNARIALVLTGMYCFGIAYSPGEGPVPFVYAAESMPLYNRDYGMGIVTSINWAFNFLVSFTWPKLAGSTSVYGGFLVYGALCLVGEVVILLIVPETKGLSKTVGKDDILHQSCTDLRTSAPLGLEQLGAVFAISTREHAAFGLKQAAWFSRRYLLRRHKQLREPKLLDDTEQEEFKMQRITHGLGDD
ncbi:hypothetical protein LTR53_004255 [Teratosphaeriaceae sp. CCFEE 6253]|nr:hypothetical protein LTR53_004255 [Teratosphaeriaceae sp. CCFEE 6253]